MLAVSTVMAGTNAGVAAAIDHTNGLRDRFHTLPMPRRLPSAARTINEGLFTLVRAAILIAAAVALGFRLHGTMLDAVAAVVVLVALAASMSALFGRIGDRLRRPDVVQFAGMMTMMPLMFVSGAFAPLATMPGWMQTMAAINPVAHATEALRGASLGTGTVADTAIALAASTVLWVLVTVVRTSRGGVRHRTPATPIGRCRDGLSRRVARTRRDHGDGHLRYGRRRCADRRSGLGSASRRGPGEGAGARARAPAAS